MVKNPCIICGKEVEDASKRRCVECQGKKKPKKHLSNFEVDTKYRESRKRVIMTLDKVSAKAIQELNGLYSLKEKYQLNEENQGLLDHKMGELISFKDEIINLKKKKELEY